MENFDQSLSEYYRSRLSVRIAELQKILVILNRQQRLNQGVVRILNALSKATDYPEIVSMAEQTLRLGIQKSDLAHFISGFENHAELQQRESSQTILSHLKQALHFQQQEELLNAYALLDQVAHSLAGSGATYGFADISAAASLLEHSAQPEKLALLETLIEILFSHVLVEDQQLNYQLLVVQKDPELGFMMEYSLHTEGFDVTLVQTASQAWKALNQSAYHLLISDWVLPDADGRRFIYELRQLKSREALSILLLASTSSIKSLNQEGLPIEALLEKPFSPSKLQETVRQLLNNKQVTHLPQAHYSVTGLPPLDSLKAFLQDFDLTHKLAYLVCFRLSPMGSETISAPLRIQFTRFLKTEIHSTFYPAEYQHNDFVVLLPELTEAQSLAFIQTLIQRYQTLEPRLPAELKAALVKIKETSLEPHLQRVGALWEGPETLPQIYTEAVEVDANTAFQILLADDDPLMASIIRFRLTQDGHVVQHVSEGDQVITRLQAEPVDLLILDIKMPGQDGFSILKQLRQIPAFTDLPVLVLTGLGNEEHLVKAFKLGANDYMTKPFSPDELLIRIGRLLKA